MDNIKSTIARTIFKVTLVSSQQEEISQPMTYKGAQEVEQFGAAKKVQAEGGSAKEDMKQAPIINKDKVGRNDPCPCGSGKKYKKCHGK